MSGDVKAIGPQGLTPRLVLETVAKDVDGFSDLFVVSFSQDGTPGVFASGNVSRLALAGAALTDLAVMYLKGEVSPDA